jgi:hypothetical protein
LCSTVDRIKADNNITNLSISCNHSLAATGDNDSGDEENNDDASNGDDSDKGGDINNAPDDSRDEENNNNASNRNDSDEGGDTSNGNGGGAIDTQITNGNGGGGAMGYLLPFLIFLLGWYRRED